MKKHDYECDRYQATLHSEGSWGDPTINPQDYDCHCEPAPRIVTITVRGPDTDGEYWVNVSGPGLDDFYYATETQLPEVFPTSKEVKEWLR